MSIFEAVDKVDPGAGMITDDLLCPFRQFVDEVSRDIGELVFFLG